MAITTASNTWQKRIDRAQRLANDYPQSAEILAFYSHIAEFQRDLSDHLGAGDDERPVGGFDMAWFGRLLQTVQDHSPQPLAEAARSLCDRQQQRWATMLDDYWNQTDQSAGQHATYDFLCRAFLEPYANLARRRATPVAGSAADNFCSFCARKPVASVLREEGAGGKRSLFCGFCSNEWDFRRLICPTCGEEQTTNLVVYRAEEFPHIRIDACDLCKTYLKTIDLTTNGLAVPVVDEIASIPLDMWAREHGYSKLGLNLFGI